MGMCVSVCPCAIWTPPRNSIQPISYLMGLGVSSVNTLFKGVFLESGQYSTPFRLKNNELRPWSNTGRDTIDKGSEVKWVSNLFATFAIAAVFDQCEWTLTFNVTYHSVVEGEDTDVSPVVDVVTPHYRVGVVLHPDAGQGVPTDLIVLVDSLKTRRAWVSIPSENMNHHSWILPIT